jgi:hypothetical protein
MEIDRWGVLSTLQALAYQQYQQRSTRHLRIPKRVLSPYLAYIAGGFQELASRMFAISNRYRRQSLKMHPDIFGELQIPLSTSEIVSIKFVNALQKSETR